MRSGDRRFIVFLAFVALVFLTGGGSRDDIQSLVFLRPACAFFIAYALTVGSGTGLARLRVPLLLLLGLAGWMILQLVPLPPALWQSLPDRAAIAAMDHAAGLDGIWRPISLSPSKTLNSLCSLVVPLAGLLLYSVLPDERRRLLPMVLVIAASASALLGLAQLAMGGHGPLYLYAITNEGNAVGLFANRNHNAVLAATMLIFVGHLVLERRPASGRRRGPDLGLVLPLCAGLLLLVVLLINGSRAGLLVGVLALGFVAAYRTAVELGTRRADAMRRADRLRRNLSLAVLGVAALVALALLFARGETIDRLVNLSVADELRVRAFGVISKMASDNFLFGIGFGAFENVFPRYETAALLQETYLNNAHNDWLQWIIEGGLPALALAGAFAAWAVQRGAQHWRLRGAAKQRVRLAACAGFALVLLLAASLLDYPLRVPSMMLYAVLLIALFADPPEPAADAGRRRSSQRR
ncbi:O-antigen ligase family protein [Sphingomonas canadensis]|uniref:O-antigen ligase family protein n=1 Tax=Sphingomonas canadensis TaxID=1219257 RepID=A0ABW3H652_9SPHN|nr:O-antigen ligase family protein [Sphingomonas canadensis]MCW3835396.1 O-antigen ligase family protein [Sphingomonas canadensis]